jgi:ribosomal protein S27AE
MSREYLYCTMRLYAVRFGEVPDEEDDMARKRTTCPRCNRDVAVISKKGKLAKHGCKPTADYALTLAIEQEATRRADLLRVAKVRASGRAWTSRLAVLGTADVALALTLHPAGSVGFGIGMLGLVAAMLGMLWSLLRWRIAVVELPWRQEMHAVTLAALDKAQLAADAAQLDADYTAGATDLDNLR